MGFTPKYCNMHHAVVTYLVTPNRVARRSISAYRSFRPCMQTSAAHFTFCRTFKLGYADNLLLLYKDRGRASTHTMPPPP
jgi:hypothetical protein